MRLAPAVVIALVLGGVIPASSARAWCQMVTPRRCSTGCLEGQVCSGTYCAWSSERSSCEVPDFVHTFPMAWGRRCTSVSVSDALPSSDLSRAEVLEVLGRSIATWEAVRCDGGLATGLDLTLLEEPDACVRGGHSTGGGNVHSLLFVREGWSSDRMHDPRAYAVTLVWFGAEGEILDADIEFNEARGPFAICPAEGCAEGLVDLEDTLTHELGHYLGIAHGFDDPLSTMWPWAAPGETHKRDLGADDVAALCAIYAPGALPDACDPAPRNGLDLTCRGERQGCGCAAPGAPSGPLPLGIAVIAALVALARRLTR